MKKRSTPVIILIVLFGINFFLKSKKNNHFVNNRTTNNLTVSSINTAELNGKKILFDATKGEQMGNADWVIMESNNQIPQIPNPPQNQITSKTNEDYWLGALSSWGIDLVKLGFQVASLPPNSSITYGDSNNPQDLSNYNVYIVDEPNVRFTSSEKTAVLNFVKNGGGLFMISDHTHSDRNNDGWDSPDIWNDLMNFNSIQKNPFGFNFDLENFSQTTHHILDLKNPLTQGSQGTVTALKYSNGTSITITNPAIATGVIFSNRYIDNTHDIMCLYSSFGKGKVVAIGDSSPADDGTGAEGNNLFFGWTDLDGSHAKLHLNATIWLANL